MSDLYQNTNNRNDTTTIANIKSETCFWSCFEQMFEQVYCLKDIPHLKIHLPAVLNWLISVEKHLDFNNLYPSSFLDYHNH